MVPLLGTPDVAWSGLAFSQAPNCLKSLTSARTAMPTKTQNSNRELADRNEILGHCRSKGGILIGIRDEQELAAICPRTASQSAS